MIATCGWLMIGKGDRRAERAHVRDREGAADDIVGTELLALRARREIADLTRDEPQPLAVGVADDRRDQALEVEIDRDAEVQIAMDDERLAVDARVDVRVVVHDVAERAHDEREVGEREALFRLPLPPDASRRVRSTRSKSTRTDVYTCALVAFERTMCSAVRRRMLSNGTTSSPAATRRPRAAGGQPGGRRSGRGARTGAGVVAGRCRAAPAGRLARRRCG